MNQDISYAHKTSISKVGMYVFLGTEGMMFSTLLAAYVVLRFGNAGWPPVGAPGFPIFLTGLNTLLLLTSSFTLHKALRCIKKGGIHRARTHLAATLVLGSCFIVIQAVEWLGLIKEGLSLKTGAYGSCFFTITGFHGLHVLIGVGLLIYLLIQNLRNLYTSENHTPLALGSMYWHFVDVVWIVIFISLYLV